MHLDAIVACNQLAVLPFMRDDNAGLITMLMVTIATKSSETI